MNDTPPNARRALARQKLGAWVTRLRSLPVDSADLLLVVAAVFAVRELLWRGLGWLDPFDETLLLVNARMLNQGRELYRDFSANYPPGIFHLVRPILAFDLPAVWSLRLAGLFVRLSSAALAAWLVGRVRGTRPCLATGTVVLMLQSRLGLVPYAYGIAVLFASLVVAWWPRNEAPRWRAFASGGILALTSFLRVDLFVYLALGLSAVEGVHWLWRRHSLLFEARRAAVDLATALCVTGLVVWSPYVLSVGVSRLAHDLVLDVGRLAMPARVLPIPPLFRATRVAALDTTLPSWLVDRAALGLLLAFAGILVSSFVIGKRLRARVEPRALLSGVLLTTFAACTLPQALGRTDYLHIVFGIPLTLAALGAHAGRRTMRVLALVALLPWVHERVRFIDQAQFVRWLEDRADPRYMPQDRAAVVQAVQERTAPGEPIFVGCSSHRRHLFVPLDVYYWSKRHGATRYMQFDPGLTTSEPVHQQMIADLERVRPKVFVRHHGCFWEEPNASKKEGSPLLDQWLEAHYVVTRKLPNFDILEPRGSATSDDQKLPAKEPPKQRKR